MNPLIRDVADTLKLYDPSTKRWDTLTLNSGQKKVIENKLFIFKTQGSVTRITRPISGYKISIQTEITCLKFEKRIIRESKCKDSEQIYVEQPWSTSVNPGYDL